MGSASGGQRHFTTPADPAVDARIQRDLDLIRETLLALDRRILTLVLVGGFGRGEGSVIRLGDRIQPYNDYDLVVIHPDPASCPPLTPTLTRLAATFAMGHLDAEILSPSDLAGMTPSMHAHDLKHGGHVFHGSPGALDPIPPISATQLGLPEARLLLFNRLTCLLEAVQMSYFKDRPTGDLAFRMAYMSHKILLCVAEAMLARTGSYRTSYQERAQAFARRFPRLPELAELVAASTRFKLSPPQDPGDPVSLWFTARHWYLEELSHCIAATHGTPFGDWLAFARVYQGSRRRDVLRKLKWFLLDRRRYRDICEGNRRVDIELAELLLIAAARPEGTFDAELTAAAAARLAPHTRVSLTDWEACRAAAVRADYLFVHRSVSA